MTPVPLRPCPAPGCAAQLQSETFACRTHWDALPKGYREEIRRDWKSGDGYQGRGARIALQWFEWQASRGGLNRSNGRVR